MRGMKNKVLRIAGYVLLWLVTAFLVMIFARQGWAKFSDSSGWAQAFVHWGYSREFRIAIGVAELAAAALLLYRRTAAYGALLIIAIMLGGVVTHVRADQLRHVRSEVMPIVLSAIVLTVRWPQRLRIAAQAGGAVERSAHSG